jgi:hypothetical protein
VETVKAIALLIVGGAAVFGVTYGIGKIPSLFSKKKKPSCCD